jgi:hypothetical protein
MDVAMRRHPPAHTRSSVPTHQEIHEMKTLVTLVCSALFLPLAGTAIAKDDKAGLPLVLRQFEREITLAPGERGNVAAVCLPGEVVVSGGPSSIPAIIDIVYSSLIYDGVGSGWAVEWINRGTQTVVVVPGTAVLCTKGTITPG